MSRRDKAIDNDMFDDKAINDKTIDDLLDIAQSHEQKLEGQHKFSQAIMELCTAMRMETAALRTETMETQKVIMASRTSLIEAFNAMVNFHALAFATVIAGFEASTQERLMAFLSRPAKDVFVGGSPELVQAIQREVDTLKATYAQLEIQCEQNTKHE
jgi:hypothetical protein